VVLRSDARQYGKGQRLQDAAAGAILDELGAWFALCRAEGVWTGGVHVEATGRDVAECIGGAEPVREADLGERYHTHCDPRLNPAQAMEVAALAAGALKRTAQARAA
jgi:3-deoxy-7-phosphoheptulonate synthase